MEYIRVADIADLPANKMITVVVKGQEVLLANIDGAYYAIANKCTHLGGSLSKGVLDGNVVKCPSRYILAMRYFEISAYNRSVADVLKKALGQRAFCVLHGFRLKRFSIRRPRRAGEADVGQHADSSQHSTVTTQWEFISSKEKLLWHPES
jgi:hypothetical protein